MRLAWFTPWTPQPTGVAGRSDEVTRDLAARGHGIDVFVDERRVPAAARAEADAVAFGHRRIQSAHDFVWRYRRRQYDAVVYQVGNSRHHDFLWPYLFRFPGLVVLHDTRLHHARARVLLAPDGPSAYRAEFAFDHPEVSPEAAELAVSGFDGAYYAMWPMTRAVLTAARLVATHSRGASSALAADCPRCPIEHIPLGEGRLAPVPDADVAALRRRLGAAPNDVVLGVFGGLSPDKRVPEILRAVADLAEAHPTVHLWLAGATDPRVDVRAMADRLGLSTRVTHLGTPDDLTFDQAIAAVDVSLHLRWPSAGETSGPWLRALAAARPTVTMELAHQTDVPALDPRDWRPRNPADPRAAVAVAIDVLDEAHSLRLALDRLVGDADLRHRLGRAGRQYWQLHHTPEAMADGYLRVLTRMIDRVDEPVELPASLKPDPWHAVRALLTPYGLTRCELP